MEGDLHITEESRRLGVGSTYLRRLERQGRIPSARRDAFSGRIYSELDVMLLRALGVGSGRRLKQLEEVLESAR